MKQNIKNIIETNGYVILKKLFSKNEINNIFKSYEKNLDYCLRLIKSSKKFESLDKKYLYLEKKNKLLKSRSYDLSKYHPSIFQLATSKKLNKILKDYFNEEFFLDLPQIRVDDNKNSFMLPPHQEIFGQMSKKIITLWAPLSNVSIKNGTIGLIEKSHLDGEIVVERNEKHDYTTSRVSKSEIPENILGKYKDTAIKVNKGDALFFDTKLIHSSGDNTSKRIRFSCQIRFSNSMSNEFAAFRPAYAQNPYSMKKLGRKIYD